MLTSKCFMPKRLYINATKKSKPLFTQRHVISVQDIHFYYSTHSWLIHPKYTPIPKQKMNFLGTTCRDDWVWFCCCPFPVTKSLQVPRHIKSLSSASKAAAISSASELLPSSSSLESLEDSSADCLFSTSSSSSSSLASSCLRLWPLENQQRVI